MSKNETSRIESIDILRAACVILVLLYHSGLQTFRSGYLGVDVFFVISGFVITRSIIHEGNEFSLIEFYKRRVRRLVPPLLVTITLCIPFSIYFMIPEDLEDFAQSVVASVLGLNNILQYLTLDYFSIEADFRPLVHTWSLGVEEQFYFLYAPLMLLCLRRKLKPLRFVIVLCMISLVSYLSLATDSLESFYLLPFRAWEILLGAILFFISSKRNPRGIVMNQTHANLLNSLILVALLYIAIFVDLPETLKTLIVTVFTLLYLWFAIPSRNSSSLIWRTFILIGRGSYSIYLIHQPLVAFFRISRIVPPEDVELLLVALLSIPIGLLLYMSVEVPINKKHLISDKLLLSSALFLSIMTISFGIVTHISSGFVNQWNELKSQSNIPSRRFNANYNERPFLFKKDKFENLKLPNVLVAGNSQTRDFLNALMESDFVNTIDSEWIYRDDLDVCRALTNNNLNIQRMIYDSEVIIVGGFPEGNCINSLFSTLSQNGKDVFVLGPLKIGYNMNAVGRLSILERKSLKVKVPEEVLALDSRLRSSFGIYYISTLDLLGLQNSSIPVVTNSNRFVSQDTIHLTKDGATLMGIKFVMSPQADMIRQRLYNSNQLRSG